MPFWSLLTTTIHNQNMITDTILNLTRTTRDVEDSYIRTSTRNKYARTYVDFIIFLFDSHPILLIDLEVLRQANVIDLNLPVQRTQKNLNVMCHTLIECINRKEHNYLIRLIRDGSLIYDRIAAFMNTKRRVITVNVDIAARLAAEDENMLQGNTDSNNQVKVAVRLGDSSYSAVQSTVLFLFRQSGVEQSAEVKGGVNLYCKGSKIKGRKLKQDLGLEIKDGKNPMSKEVYSFLAKKYLLAERLIIYLCINL